MNPARVCFAIILCSDYNPAFVMSQTSLLSFFGKKSASNETDQCDSEDEEDEEVHSPIRSRDVSVRLL